MSPLTISVEKVRDAFVAAQRSTVAGHPGWDAADARITVFAKCVNVLDTVRLQTFCLENYVASPEWWTQLVGEQQFAPGDIRIAMREFEVVARLAYHYC